MTVKIPIFGLFMGAIVFAVVTQFAINAGTSIPNNAHGLTLDMVFFSLAEKPALAVSPDLMGNPDHPVKFDVILRRMMIVNSAVGALVGASFGTIIGYLRWINSEPPE